ncbi:MAG: DNA-binding protein [Alphaproteobacteria bacterium]
MNNIERELLPIPEFIAKFAISRTSVYREIAAGRLRMTKRGSRSFIARQDAQTWLETLRTNSGGRP